MPITKQVIKRVKQANIRRDRNKHYSSRMRSMMKLFLTHLEKGEIKKAQAIFTDVISSIDTAAKKGLIHGNNANHKKSRMQRAMDAAMEGGKKVAKKEEVNVAA